jgi:GNAT superfamily N-acetyltransferase
MSVSVTPAAATADLAAARALVVEFLTTLATDFGFQDPDAGLADFPGAYAPPRGRLLLARVDGRPAGCVALRPLGDEVCEMKRLYVRSAFRGRGVGRALVAAVLDAARQVGYRRMVLDTMAVMTDARALYWAAGFRPTAPYYPSLVPDPVYLERELL